MEKTVLNTSLQNSESDDRNKNIFEISPKGENKIKTVDQLNKYFERLKIQSYVDHDEEKSKCFAGKINNIINILNIAIVKPCFSDILLYVGTPLFVICTNIENNRSKYTFLGYIDDIFGSIGEPMYSIAMKCSPTHALNIDEQVYYFPNLPNTLHMYLEHTTDKLCNNKRYNIKTKSL
ncbi:hypothetical protein ANTQUA_LOCUS2866 [Anthophora quadrimaculata]